MKDSCFSRLHAVGHPVSVVVNKREREGEGRFNDNETLTVHFPLSDENDEKTDINRLQFSELCNPRAW